MPTSVLKQVADLVAPFIVELFNRSLAADHFPAGFKEAFITPLVKKPGLDVADVNSYRPILKLVGDIEAPRASRCPPVNALPDVC
jgi:hypothetical protein